MTIFLMIFRKMLNNRWMVGSLLLGLIITLALISSIPTYTSGVLQRLMVKELEEFQNETNQYPGGLYQFLSLRQTELGEARDLVHNMEQFFNGPLKNYTDLPDVSRTTVLTTVYLSYLRKSEWDLIQQGESASSGSFGRNNIRLFSLKDINNHVVLKDGRFPSTEPTENGVYEALLTEQAQARLNMVVDVEGVLIHPSGESIAIKPVGIIGPKDESDPYWMGTYNLYTEGFIIPDSTLRVLLLEEGVERVAYPDERLEQAILVQEGLSAPAEGVEEEALADVNWLANVKFFAAYDYYAMTLDDIPRMLTVSRVLRNHILNTTDNNFDVTFPMAQRLSRYLDQERQLITLLWSLNIPIIIMLGLYLFMVSKLIVDRQKTEIAVLRSRGAGTLQIMFIYLTEVLILCALALLAGPYIGLYLSKMLGASNGFLEFVQRTALPVRLTPETYKYAFYTLAASIVMVMIPVYMATRENIVSHKSGSIRSIFPTLWQKFFIDILLLLIAWYGWRSYQRRAEELGASQMDLHNLPIDPLMFFVPSIFIIGMGLFCLRLYPWVVRIIYWFGKRFWSAPMYNTMVQVIRSSKQYQFLMLFLIMTIGVGIFNASAARTINTNLEEQIRYANGADIVLQQRWQSDAPLISFDMEGMEEGGGESPQPRNVRAQYAEPPFYQLLDLPGVEHATRVFDRTGVTVEGRGNRINSSRLMAIEPKDFGQTAWFKTQLTSPHHWFAYLNLLAQEPSSVLISESVARRLDVRAGDNITMRWSGTEQAQFVVYGVINYWPSFNPNREDGENQDPMLVVANLSYVQTSIGLEPYNVWMKLSENASMAELYDQMQENRIILTRLDNTLNEIIVLKNGAFLLGLNGTLTMGFLIALIVTLLGFLLYWIITLSSRILQYGVFRAMGMSLRQLITMMSYEQLLTSGMACLLGVILGAVTSRIFVPMLQLSFGGVRDVPPFQVIFDAADEMRLYIFVSSMLIFGLIILSWLISKIKIHQAVKLGED